MTIDPADLVARAGPSARSVGRPNLPATERDASPAVPTKDFRCAGDYADGYRARRATGLAPPRTEERSSRTGGGSYLGLLRSSSCGKEISDAANGANEIFGAGEACELLAQTADVNVNTAIESVQRTP